MTEPRRVGERVFEVDLANPPSDAALTSLGDAMIVVRLDGVVMGAVWVPCPEGRLEMTAIREAIDADPELASRLVTAVVEQWLMREVEPTPRPIPSASVVVCTRDRPEQLRSCLKSLRDLASAPSQVVVVDNAPSDDRARVVASEFDVVYAVEPQPGLNRARRRGAAEAQGDVLIFTDDDVVVEPAWSDELLDPFAGSPRTGATTGLVLPVELATRAQELFERWTPFSRGFARRELDLSTMAPSAAAGRAGAGASMAIRRELVAELGVFDAEFDGGTPTMSGGDTYGFYRILDAGYRIVYTPRAVAWHRHRRTHEELRRQWYGYSVGGFAALSRELSVHHDLGALRVAFEWFRDHHVRQLVHSVLRRPDAIPLDLVWAEVRGALQGPVAHRQARKLEQRSAA